MAQILVISERTDVPRFIRRALAGEGHRTTVLTHIREAMDHIRAHGPDLVLIDRLASGFDCFEALLTIKAHFSLLPALIYVMHRADAARRLKIAVNQALKERQHRPKGHTPC